MLHYALPQTYTPENLAAWIMENQIEKKEDLKQIALTPEGVALYEHKSSVASRQIYDLKNILSVFQSIIKKGTPTNFETQNPDPVSMTIPPTLGLDVLEKRREVAEQTIKNGFEIVYTWVYGFPVPEEEKIIFVDIEGNRFESHDYQMNPEQVEKYSKPILKVSKKNKKQKDFMDETPIQTEDTVDQDDLFSQSK